MLHRFQSQIYCDETRHAVPESTAAAAERGWIWSTLSAPSHHHPHTTLMLLLPSPCSTPRPLPRRSRYPWESAAQHTSQRKGEGKQQRTGEKAAERGGEKSVQNNRSAKRRILVLDVDKDRVVGLIRAMCRNVLPYRSDKLGTDHPIQHPLVCMKVAELSDPRSQRTAVVLACGSVGLFGRSKTKENYFKITYYPSGRSAVELQHTHAATNPTRRGRHVASNGRAVRGREANNNALKWWLPPKQRTLHPSEQLTLVGASPSGHRTHTCLSDVVHVPTIKIRFPETQQPTTKARRWLQRLNTKVPPAAAAAASNTDSRWRSLAGSWLRARGLGPFSSAHAAPGWWRSC